MIIDDRQTMTASEFLALNAKPRKAPARVDRLCKSCANTHSKMTKEAKGIYMDFRFSLHCDLDGKVVGKHRKACEQYEHKTKGLK